MPGECPLCGKPARGGPWGGDYCGDAHCMASEWAATPPHLRRGSVSMSTHNVGSFNCTVWVYLPSGRQMVAKQEIRGRLSGPKREQYLNRAIGYEPLRTP